MTFELITFTANKGTNQVKKFILKYIYVSLQVDVYTQNQAKLY